MELWLLNQQCVFVGTGLLSVPSTIQEGGWASVGLLLLYAVMCYFTGYLLRKCMEINKDIITFPDLGEAAFGNLGRVFVSFSFVEFIMMEADNLAKLFPKASLQWGNIYFSPVQFLGILSALIVLPTCYLRDLRYGLASVVFSKDLERCERVSKLLESGAVWVSCSQPCFVHAPWGGIKSSGFGHELEEWGIENYLNIKQVTSDISNEPWGCYKSP